MAQMQRPSKLAWRKSTFSEAGGCVEISCVGQVVFVRDSKDHTGPVQEISARRWMSFIEQVRTERFRCDVR